MKKLLLASLAIFTLTACGNDEPKKKNPDNVQVDKNFTNVEMTLPAIFFEGQSEEEIEKSAKEDGVKEVHVNDDGTVTYKMSKKKHDDMMNDMKKAVEDAEKDLVESGDYASFKKITHSKNYQTFNVTVDMAEYEGSFDAFGLMALGISSMYYSIFNGIPADEATATMNLIDDKTGKTVDKVVFPDDLQNEQ